MMLNTLLLVAVALTAAGCATAQDVNDANYQYWCNPPRGGALCGRITGSDDHYSVPGSQIDHAGFAGDNKSFFIECPAAGRGYSITSHRFVQLETQGQVQQRGKVCCKYNFAQKHVTGVWCPGDPALIL